MELRWLLLAATLGCAAGPTQRQERACEHLGADLVRCRDASRFVTCWGTPGGALSCLRDMPVLIVKPDTCHEPKPRDLQL